MPRAKHQDPVNATREILPSLLREGEQLTGKLYIQLIIHVTISQPIPHIRGTSTPLTHEPWITGLPY